MRGLGIVDRDSPTQCVRSLAEENLSTNIHDRLKILFKTKSRWTMDEIEPYMEYNLIISLKLKLYFLLILDISLHLR